LLVLNVLAMAFNIAGSSRCTAALSATIFTASQMVVGYALDILLLGTTVQPLTLAGAALMFIAVLIMASTAGAPSHAVETSLVAAAEPHCQHVPDAVDRVMSTRTNWSATTKASIESVGSFIASEFVEFMPTAETSMRSQRPFSSAEPSAAQAVGLPPPAVVAAVELPMPV
jgi:hypothetical protein